MLLHEHSFLHLYFQNGASLLYDIFVTSNKMLHYKRLENELTIFSYYLKRFLLFDSEASIPIITKSADLITKSIIPFYPDNIDVPDDFLPFIKDQNERTVHFYDK